MLGWTYLKRFVALLLLNADGSASSTKFWQAVGYVTSTWVIVRLTLSDKMSSEYLLIYLGALTAARGFQNYLAARGQNPSAFRTAYRPGPSDEEDTRPMGAPKAY